MDEFEILSQRQERHPHGSGLRGSGRGISPASISGREAISCRR